ncbi:tumor necrosis factor receptor superfamily member 1B isoform X2 [Entelurus aequoreus]|uniref:tumor necrosis factor receptor superfamily member 1B isoform X2 n=1 Tax=Entelurus aequoreus TaxID=161455 RepID=UPI002B1E0A77|nr:tumor necrosis factor receptor superfamily member 1B isoform X2 [Entelurus aequoreus]
MKDVFVLLSVHAMQVLALPYQAELGIKCINPDREYLLEALGLCCSKCRPGRRLTQECNETADSVCETCGRDQYMESWNYAPNCFSCAKCRTYKGLQFTQVCLSTAMSKCECRPGMYCIMESDEQHCTECLHHTACKAGYGVSVPGTSNANVKCKQCSDGTFSDVSSAVEPCRPHKSCHGRPVLKAGTSTWDTVCEADPLLPHVQTSGHANQTYSSISTTSPDSVLSSPKSLGSDTKHGTGRLQPEDNANENGDDEIDEGHLGETLLTLVAFPQQQCLLQRGEVSGDSGHCSSSSDTGSQESGESTQVLQQSAASETPVRPTQPPVAASPHVNVNITFNIGDGDPRRTQPAGLMQRHSDLSLGHEEEGQESLCVPQQEEGRDLFANENTLKSTYSMHV